MATSKQASIEKAWDTLLKAGVLTPDDQALLMQRQRDRVLLSLASRALAEGKENGVISVTVVTERTLYIAEQDAAPRIAPRVTAAPSRRRERKANGDKPEASADAETGDGEDIPTEILRKASDALGLKWFGAKNARRSKRIIQKARELIAGQ